jgi:hypothetical protein
MMLELAHRNWLNLFNPTSLHIQQLERQARNLHTEDSLLVSHFLALQSKELQLRWPYRKDIAVCCEPYINT